MSTTATETKCSMSYPAEGRICDQPAVGIYKGIGGHQPACQTHADQLRRTWGIRVAPLDTKAEAA